MIRAIFFKEMREIFRDKNSLVVTFLLPTLIMPLMFSGYTMATAFFKKMAEGAQLHYSVQGKEYAPTLYKVFVAAPGLKEASVPVGGDVGAAIKEGVVDFSLDIPRDFESTIAAQHQVKLVLHYNDAVSFDVIKAKVATIIDNYSSELRAGTLSGLGLSAAHLDFALSPVKLETATTADNRQAMGEKMGGTLAYILLITAMTGAAFSALDIVVGEKSRGTLETLLVAPIARRTIVYAKFLVLFSNSLIMSLLSVFSIALLVLLLRIEMLAPYIPPIANAFASVGLWDIALIGVMLVPIASTFSALMLVVSAYSKSFKEAQGYLGLCALCVTVPVMLALLPGIKLNWAWSMMPLTNIALVVKEILKGTASFSLVALSLVSIVLLTALLLAHSERLFRRESILEVR